MDTPNPFAPPGVNVNDPAIVPSWEGVPPSVVVILSQTRPWLRLLLGLMVTVGALAVVWMVRWAVYGMMRKGYPLFAYSGVGFLILVAITIIMPAVYLARSAQAIRRLQTGGGVPALEDALRSQHSFWRYVGLLTLALVAIYGVVFALVASRM